MSDASSDTLRVPLEELGEQIGAALRSLHLSSQRRFEARGRSLRESATVPAALYRETLAMAAPARDTRMA